MYLYERLEYIGQLNQELFITVLDIINTLAGIYDLDSSIVNILPPLTYYHSQRDVTMEWSSYNGKFDYQCT